MQSVRRLAAIVFTDIVGYTATMQISEARALNQVNKHQLAVESLTKQYGGEVLNYYGDGSLSMFPSVTDAIECAGRIQDKMHDSPSVPLRIGIHLGEIYFKDGKYLGDGINIASRLQSEAEEGQIYVSEGVFQTAKNKSNFQFETIGARQLKNIKQPMQIHRVVVTSYSGGIANNLKVWRSKWLRGLGIIFLLVLLTMFVVTQVSRKQPSRRGLDYSIVIKPFEDQHLDDPDALYGAGIANEIRSKLSGIHQLDVRSMSSSMFLQDKNWTAKEISEKLDVHYILEGSMRQQGNLVYLNLALIDARLDQLIQPIDYQCEMDEDFIRIQNEIARVVINLVKIKLLPKEQEKIDKLETENLEAYKSFLIGKYFLLQSANPADKKKSGEYFREAIELDPLFAKAYAGLAEALIYPGVFGHEPVSRAIENAAVYAEKAYRLDPTLAETNQVMGTIYFFSENFTEAEIMFEKAIEIDPTFELSSDYRAWLKMISGDHDQALLFQKQAIQLNPYSPVLKGHIIMLLIQAGRLGDAIAAADSALIKHPNDDFILFNKGVAQIMEGNLDEAIETFLERPVPTRERNWALGYAYALKGDSLKARLVLDYLLERNKQSYVPPSMIACVYLGLGNMEKVYEWFPKEDYFWFKAFPFFVELQGDPELEEAFSFRKPFLD